MPKLFCVDRSKNQRQRLQGGWCHGIDSSVSFSSRVSEAQLLPAGTLPALTMLQFTPLLPMEPQRGRLQIEDSSPVEYNTKACEFIGHLVYADLPRPLYHAPSVHLPHI